ncbi:VOC family protein [Nocardiopsis sp. NPDC006139]|uniref:VOC family protein n=1 Tax=unclassified Nocardiopsis TaxID=2649073 RepID=UPI0033BBCA71
MASMTHLYAVLPVTDVEASLGWYTALFGRPADEVVGEETMWRVDEAAWVVVAAHPDRAGGGILTLGVTGLDRILARLTAHGAGREPVETYGNGVRHVVARDPDGNSVSLAEAPPAESP